MCMCNTGSFTFVLIFLNNLNLVRQTETCSLSYHSTYVVVFYSGILINLIGSFRLLMGLQDLLPS